MVKGAATVLADEAVVNLPWFEAALTHCPVADVVRVRANPTWDNVDALARRLRSRGPEEVWVIGGGAVGDMARLARRVWCRGDPLRTALTRGRQGYVFIDAHRSCGPTIGVIPTTLGTGAEASAAACVLVDGRRRLVLSRGLRADFVVYVPEAYQTLSDQTLRQGLLEVIARVMGPYIVSRATPADAAAAEAWRRLDALSRRLMDRDTGSLGELARLSAWTHGADFAEGRPAFSSPLWYLANEVSTAATTTKMTAHEALVGPCLTAADRYGGRWGSVRRLHHLLHAAGVCACHDRGDSLERVLAWLRPHACDLDQTLDYDPCGVADACERHWGHGLPALSGIPRWQLEEVLAEGAHSTERNLDARALLAAA
jgi:NADP-dependent alcohol dehydrogenase